MNIIPTVVERMNGQGSMVSYDLLSRLMQDRILFVGGNHGAIDTDDANILISQLLYLESIDDNKNITLYINSPGGSVLAGLAIYDTMQHVTCPITTIVMGHAMSFGALLLAAGTPGQRYALPNARIMIHQPLIHGGGISGQATDIEIEAREMVYHKARLTEILAEHCSQPLEKVKADCERNFYMSAEEAKAYGLIDEIVKPLKKTKKEKK